MLRNKRWRRRNALFLCLTLSATSACVHGSTEVVVRSDYCRIAAPISYDSTRDTPETVAQIEAHNSKWVCVCERDCPAQDEGK